MQGLGFLPGACESAAFERWRVSVLLEALVISLFVALRFAGATI